MKIICGDIADFMEELAPARLAEEWDNVGLLVGSTQTEVRRVLLAMDVTADVLDEAAGMKAELIITHHPFIFKGLKNLREENPKGRLAAGLIRNGIGVFCAHTNLDVAEGGVNDVLARKLGLKDTVNFKDYGPPDGAGGRHGLGKVGFLEERLPLAQFVESVKAALDISHVRVTGDAGAGVKKAAVFCGSFDDDLVALERHKPDVLVTGDVKYHTAVDALQVGSCLIDAGHFNTEKVMLPVLAGLLENRFPGISVSCSRLEKEPFTTY